MENQQPQKRKAEMMDEVKKPPAKKIKQGPVPLQVEHATYLSQVRGMCELQVKHVVLQSSGKRDV